MSRKKTFSIMAAASAMALTLSACGGSGGNDAGGDSGGGSSEGDTMRLALNQTEQHPSYITLTDFGERLSGGTDGWDIQVYPNETLGAQQEALQLVSDGSVEMAIVSGTQLENLNENFKVFNLPGVFQSIDHQMNVLNDEEIIGDLFTSLEEDENITVLSGGFTQGARSVYNSQRPIETPEDMNSLKFRVQESDVAQEMIRRMGGSPAPMAYGEVYSALQSGVIDGAENNEISYLTQKHNEVAQYFSYTEHLVGIDYMITNTDVLESMSEQDRETFQQEWSQTVDDFTALWKTQTEAAHATLEEEGVEFNQVDKQAFEEALAPIVEQNLSNEAQRQIYEATRAAAE